MAAFPEAPVIEHRARRIVAGRAGDAAARMRARTAQIEAFERHAVIGVADHRPSAEQLVEAHLPMENVATDEAEAALEIERRVDLAADYRLGEPRRVCIHGGNDRIGGLLSLLVPTAAGTEFEPKMLAEQRRDVPSLGRQR